MFKARKENRVVRIPDEKAEEYKALGYSLYNEKNEIVYQHVKDSDKIAKLEKRVADLTEEKETLAKKVAFLEGQLNEAKMVAEKAEIGSVKAQGKKTTK